MVPHLLSPERPLTNREKSKARGAMRRALAGTGRSEVAVVMRYLFDLVQDGDENSLRDLVELELEDDDARLRR